MSHCRPCPLVNTSVLWFSGFGILLPFSALCLQQYSYSTEQLKDKRSCFGILLGVNFDWIPPATLAEDGALSIKNLASETSIIHLRNWIVSELMPDLQIKFMF